MLFGTLLLVPYKFEGIRKSYILLRGVGNSRMNYLLLVNILIEAFPFREFSGRPG